MEYYIDNFKVIIEENSDQLGKKCAAVIAAQINENKKSVMGFATGSSPIKTYQELIKLFNEGAVDFSEITSFNLDEYHFIKKSNEQSYDYFMKDNFFNHININKSKIHIPNGEAEDVKAECLDYEAQIKQAGGIDLQLLGIGLNGHIGFNEPDSVFSRDTQYVDLTESTINANARFFDTIADVPKKAISMGIKTIMMAKKIVLIANGEAKADIIYQMIHADIMPGIPATVLQLHRDVTVIIDKEAGSKLNLV